MVSGLGQISDIHSGSFHNKKAVLEGGIHMLLKEKAGFHILSPATLLMINITEMKCMATRIVFSKVKAPAGCLIRL